MTKGRLRRARKQTNQLRMEALEDRHLLAADILSSAGIDGSDIEIVNYDNDPFSPTAFPLSDLLERTETHLTVPGELSVAFAFTTDAAREATLTDSFWNQAIETPVTWTVGMDYQRENGTNPVVVDLQFDRDVDVRDLMKALDRQDEVLWSSPTFHHMGGDARELIPNDPSFANQYHHQTNIMNNVSAWDITTGDPSVLIAVTDDGISLSHVDLAANLWTNSGETPGDNIDNDGNGYIDDVDGWDFAAGNNDPNPNSSFDDHGTHVAGIAAGRIDNNVGIAGTAGTSSILPVQFYDPSLPWTGTLIRDAFEYAVDNGAQIVTTSYNINGWVGDPNFTAGIQYIHDSGSLHFNSAGNGSELNPARQAFTQSLLVASTTSSDSLSSFSNYGVGIDISAPGSDILSSIPGNAYDFFSGTSMAAPNAAGVAALIWSANPGWSNYQVAAQLIGTADSIDAQNPAFVGLLGGGRVNSFNALSQTVAPASVAGLIGAPPNGAVTEDVTIDEIEVDFDGVLDPATANDASNFELRNAGADGIFDTADDEVVPATLTSQYMFGSNQVTLSLANTLEIGDYRLSVLSDGITDPFGTPLDGDNDGIAGGNYETFFSVVNPFKRVGPEPSLISKRTDANANLSGAGDSDKVDFFAEAGETITAIATPTNASATITLELLGGDGPISSPSPGESVILPVTVIPADGDYTVEASANAETNYSLEIYRNVDVQGLEESAGAVAIDDSGIALGSTRFAAAGFANGNPAGVSFSQYNDATAFVDISATGTSLGLGDDGEANITSTVGNAIFPAGPVTIGNNGVIAAGSGVNIDYNNEPIPTSEFNAALLPFWDDIDSDSGDVYWQETTVDGINTLIVQWDNRPHYSNIGSSTFQLQLFESGPILARYAYQDVDFGDPAFNGGASATIGYQGSSVDGSQYSIDSAILAANDVIDISSGVANSDTDEFTVDLSGAVGSRMDLYFETSSPAVANTTIELLDPSNAVVATAVTGNDFDYVINDVLIDMAGSYTIRVETGYTAEYYLIATDGLAIEEEPNNTLATARDISAFDGAFVVIDGGAASFTQYNDASLFVDISATGTPLGLSDDAEATISTTVGNDSFPAGTVTVGNNGVVTTGPNVAVGTGGSPLPTASFDAALAVFWDDIDSDTGEVYWTETVVDGINTLIVQWDDRPIFSNTGDATFQVQLFESGPIVARYVYQDVEFGDPDHDFGATATIGFQSDSSTGSTFSDNQAVLAAGDVIDISTSNEDLFRVDLAGGEEATFETSTPFDHPSSDVTNTLDVDLALYDSSGSIVATDTDSAGDGKNAIIQYTPLSSDTYYIGVVYSSGSGEYVLSTDGSTPPITCDLDGDSNCDTDDMRVLYDDIALMTAGGPSDLDGSGTVDNEDIDDWLAAAGTFNGKTYVAGDTNLDGNVTGIDFTTLAFNFGTSGTPGGAYWDAGNFDGVGDDNIFIVGGSDFSQLAFNFGHTSVASIVTTSETGTTRQVVTEFDSESTTAVSAEVATPAYQVAEASDGRLRTASTRVIDQVFGDLDDEV